MKRKSLMWIIVCFALLFFTAAAWTAPVPGTGQEKCYDAAGNVITCPSPGQALYGQDANYRINPITYSKLDVSGNVLPASATSWVMVRDNVTGLIWELKNNMDGKTDYSNPHDSDNEYTWYDSNPATNGGDPGTPNPGKSTEDFIKALNDTKYGGYSDWRLPTIKELAYIVNYSISYPGPTIDAGYFPSTQASFYWASSTFAYDTSVAWGVIFNYGYDGYADKNGGGFVRAVRGGLSASLDALDSESLNVASTAGGGYTDNGNGTVTDTSTNLVWQQTGPANTMTWQQALAYCEGLNLGNHTDWRPPTTKELRSLADYSRHSPAINTTYFPSARAAFYWSSTTYSSNTSNACGVDYDYGFDNYDGKSNNYYVRAVRGGQSAPLDHSVLFSNSIGSRNTINISDMSGTLPVSGGAITVSAWDTNGNALPESSGAAPLVLYNHGTNGISGSVLAARFPNGAPMTYKFSIDSTKVAITNEKNSTNDTFKVPTVYLNGVTNFASNAIGNYNTIKISDISGTLPASGAAINVLAWDASGNALAESGSAAPLKLSNHGTTSISGSDLAARFPTGSPMIYEFAVPSAKVLITNVKSSTDGKLNVPVVYTSGVSNFVSNSIGDYNTLEISDLSGTLPLDGGAITVSAWDTNGNALSESGSATPLKLSNHGTTSILGTNLAARFPTGSPMTYEFSIASSKVLITNVKSSTDGLVEIPSIFAQGISNFATNYVNPLNTIKISDTSGALPVGGASISIAAWDTNGNVMLESAAAIPLKLYSLGTTIISGSELLERFPSGFPVLYEFSIGSSNAIITSLTTSVDGTIKTPTVFTIGVYGGI